MKSFHKRGGGQSVFILLFRNLKAQNGMFWARIECLDVSDNSDLQSKNEAKLEQIVIERSANNSGPKAAATVHQ